MTNSEDLAHHDLLYYLYVPQPPGIPNSTYIFVYLILSLVLKWFGIAFSTCPFPCKNPIPIIDSFVALRDFLCNHPSCETIVWQIEGKSILQLVVSLSSCTYCIVHGLSQVMHQNWGWAFEWRRCFTGLIRCSPQMRRYLPGTKSTFIVTSPILCQGQLNGGESCIMLESRHS